MTNYDLELPPPLESTLGDYVEDSFEGLKQNTSTSMVVASCLPFKITNQCTNLTPPLLLQAISDVSKNVPRSTHLWVVSLGTTSRKG